MLIECTDRRYKGEKIGLVFYTDVSILKNGFTSFEVMTIIRGI